MNGRMATGTRVTRPTWLVLATDGPATALLDLPGAPAIVGLIADPRAFVDRLIASPPRLAILAEPPATRSELDVVCRERRRRSGLRTIHLSPLDAIDRRVAALRVGFDEALPQTIDLAELVERATLLDERSRSRPATVLAIGDGFELDLVAHELRVEGQAVHLRPKEFQLLAMLAAHPGRAYTRRQLLDRIWGPKQVGDPRTVDVHVRWLRAKIEPEPERPVHLITVRGIGYRLDPPLTEP